jgi:uncharacterized protein (DUF58 family)
MGLTRALATRGIVERFAEALVEEDRRGKSGAAELPRSEPLAPRTQAVLIGDFLSPPQEIVSAIQAMAASGATGHVVMIADPVEETFPFSGHMEFLDVDSDARLLLGEAEALRDAYIGRLAAHRDVVRQACQSRGWSFTVHRTDRPAAEVLLALRTRLEAGRGAV